MSALNVLIYPLPVALVLLLLGFVLRARAPRVGLVLITVAVAGLWPLATEPVSHHLRAQLEGQHAPLAPTEAPSADAIVILGGGTVPTIPPRLTPGLGHAGDRVRMGYELHAAGRAPLVITTGGAHREDPMGQSEAAAAAELLERWGVPRNAIVARGNSETTREDALTVRSAIEGVPVERLLLVTSAMHMPRAVALFEHLNMEVIPAPANFELRETRPLHWSDWVPSARSLWLSTRVWHEYVGRWYAGWRDWL